MARCMNALFLLFFVSGQSGSVRDPGANLKREVCESLVWVCDGMFA